MGSGTEGDHLTIVFLRAQSLDAFRDLAHFLGSAYQQHLKFSVLHIYLVWIQCQNAANTGGIADCAEQEIILNRFVVQLHSDMNGPNLGKFLDAFQKISHVPQCILDALRGRVAGSGKGAERCHITEISVFKSADVIAHRTACQDGTGCLHRLGGKLQAGCKIVGGAGRDISDGNVRTAVHETVDGFVKGSITAAAHDHSHFRSVTFDSLYRVAGAGGNVSDDRISCLTEFT